MMLGGDDAITLTMVDDQVDRLMILEGGVTPG